MFRKLFSGKQNKPLTGNAAFWDWFEKNEAVFFNAVSTERDIEGLFFDKLSPKLDALRPGYFFLAGMTEPGVAELIITVEGAVKNINFAEELIAAAPRLRNWKFTALAQPSDLNQTDMAGYLFNKDTISFFPNADDRYSDEIDITIVHRDYREDNRQDIINGSYIFLDGLLGELNMATQVDNIEFAAPESGQPEHIPIGKLKEFLNWREKEFLEKYEGVRSLTDEDQYGVFNARTADGRNLVAKVNQGLLSWDRKMSHPWIVKWTMRYPDQQNNGYPTRERSAEMDALEDRLGLELKDEDGYLNVARQTGGGSREIYFACREFRKPSKQIDEMIRAYSGALEMEFRILKDKYWRCLMPYAQDKG